jgi:hypothetical protein
MQSTEEYRGSASDRDLLDVIEECEAAGNHAIADYYREHLAASQAMERGDYQDAERILRRLPGRRTNPQAPPRREGLRRAVR